MALNIKDPRTDDLVRRLAARSGESITEAIRVAVEERLARLTAAPPELSARDEAMAIIRRARQRAVQDDRSEDEILGYGPDGLPA